MKLTKTSSAAVALAISALLGTAAQAQVFNPGDVIIGFQQSGAANSYEVDLGSVTQFINPSSPTLTFNLSSSDLAGTFTDWTNNSQAAPVQWGVIGASNKAAFGDLTLGSVTLPADVLFYTVAGPNIPVERSSGSQGAVVNNIAVLDSQFNSAPTTTPGSTASLQAIQITSSAQGSFAYENGHQSSFGLGGNSAILSSSTTGPIGATLNFYEVTPTNADALQPTTLLGQFGLDGTGVVTFTAAAPEPSTYALMGLGLVILAWNLRRKADLLS